jgi:hypothetical protein
VRSIKGEISGARIWQSTVLRTATLIAYRLQVQPQARCTLADPPRIPFGLDRLPRSIGIDDMRLPAASVSDVPLRLNTEPLPAAAMLEAPDDLPNYHRARVAAAADWLVSLCGDYVPLRRRFIATYFAFLDGQITAHQTELTADLARYDGLYVADDWFWSGLRPLPRAWLPGPEGRVPTEIAFWDGSRPIAVEISPHDAPRQAALRTAGIEVLRIDTDALATPATLGALLPAPFHNFWRGQALPASPFRRPMPRGVLDAPTA